MSILVDKDSKVVVQGITVSEGTFHSQQMIDYGTNIVAGVTPGKGGLDAVDGKVPVFNSVEEAVKETDANVSIIFVPPPFAADAIIEASETNIKLVGIKLICVLSSSRGKIRLYSTMINRSAGKWENQKMGKSGKSMRNHWFLIEFYRWPIGGLSMAHMASLRNRCKTIGF